MPKLPVSLPFHVGRHLKLWHSFRVGHLTSNDPVKEILHTCVQLLGSELIPDAVMLTTNVSHHKRDRAIMAGETQQWAKKGRGHRSHTQEVEREHTLWSSCMFQLHVPVSVTLDEAG